MDIFAPFEKPEHLPQFATYMKKQQPSIEFSAVGEKNGALSSLDLILYIKNEIFIINVYKKKKLSVVCKQISPI